MPILLNTKSPQLYSIVSGSYVILDLEFTSWSDSLLSNWKSPHQFREIVELSYIYLSYDSDLTEFTILSYDTISILPKINPTLSRHFINLTGITNDSLSSSRYSFTDLLFLMTFFSDLGATFISNGDDVQIINENIMLYGFLVEQFFGYSISNLLSSFYNIPASKCISSEMYRYTPYSDKHMLVPHKSIHDCFSLLFALSFQLDAKINGLATVSF